MADNSKYTYQMNAYFGIFYYADSSKEVLSMLSNGEYSVLNSENAELVIDGILIFASMNSDSNDARYGFITADNMTIEGPDHDAPTDIALIIKPHEMVKREENNIKTVKIITDIYGVLVKECKKRKLKLDLYMGWKVLSCAWDLDSDDSDATVLKNMSTNNEVLAKRPKPPKN